MHGPNSATGGGRESVQNGAFTWVPHTKRRLQKQGHTRHAGRDETRQEHREGTEQRHGSPPRSLDLPITWHARVLRVTIGVPVQLQRQSTTALTLSLPCQQEEALSGHSHRAWAAATTTWSWFVGTLSKDGENVWWQQQWHVGGALQPNGEAREDHGVCCVLVKRDEEGLPCRRGGGGVHREVLQRIEVAEMVRSLLLNTRVYVAYDMEWSGSYSDVPDRVHQSYLITYSNFLKL